MEYITRQILVGPDGSTQAETDEQIMAQRAAHAKGIEAERKLAALVERLRHEDVASRRATLREVATHARAAADAWDAHIAAQLKPFPCGCIGYCDHDGIDR